MKLSSALCMGIAGARGRRAARVRMRYAWLVGMACLASCVGCMGPRCPSGCAPAQKGLTDSAEAQAHSGGERRESPMLEREPGVLTVVVDDKLSGETGYHPGHNKGRYSDLNAVDLDVTESMVETKYVLVYSIGHIGSQEVVLTLDSSSRAANAAVSSETHMLSKVAWTHVYGMVVISRWPLNATDPVVVRFFVCGQLGGAAYSISDWFTVP